MNRPLPQHGALDVPLQCVAVAALHQQLAELAGRHVEDGLIVVLDNVSGEVLAWVGSSGSFSDGSVAAMLRAAGGGRRGPRRAARWPHCAQRQPARAAPAAQSAAPTVHPAACRRANCTPQWVPELPRLPVPPL